MRRQLMPYKSLINLKIIFIFIFFSNVFILTQVCVFYTPILCAVKNGRRDDDDVRDPRRLAYIP